MTPTEIAAQLQRQINEQQARIEAQHAADRLAAELSRQQVISQGGTP
ncbi:hypothetical protein [Kitasatospora sp. NPDC002040]